MQRNKDTNAVNLSTIVFCCSNKAQNVNAMHYARTFEALACGCPVVSTDCPSGRSEILEQDRWGRLVPVNDQTVLAKAITATLEDDTNHDALRQRATQFSLEKMIENFETLIREVISKNQGQLIVLARSGRVDYRRGEIRTMGETAAGSFRINPFRGLLDIH